MKFNTCLIITSLFSLHVSAVEIIDRVAIIVGEGVVLESQVDTMLNTVKSRLNQQGVQLPPDEILLEQVNERLIVEELQLQMGNRAGVRISDGELNATIEDIAKNNNLNLDEFVSSFESRDQTYQEFRNQIRKEMIIQRVQRGKVASSIEITEQELLAFLASEEALDQLYPEYEVAQILVPSESLANAVLEEIQNGKDFAELAKQYSQASNASNGGSLGFRKINAMPSIFAEAVKNEAAGFVSAPLKTGAGYQILKLNAKQGSLVQFQDQWNVRHILMTTTKLRDEVFTKKELEEVRERVVAGESFELLAKEFSEDPGSASRGGELDWLSKGVTDPNFEKMFLETEIGEISPVFESQFGFHFLEVLGKRNYERTFDIIEDQAYNILFSRKYDEELENSLRTMRAEAFVEFKDLD
ncbi:MAG: peptidylprolyl isomerase [Gammaproteobacteria bacterium]